MSIHTQTITMKPVRILQLALVLTLALHCSAAARTLAVFPLLDLSLDANGVNFPLTGYLSKKAVEQGFTVLPESEVMAFMVRHRIRSLGVLTSYQLSTLHQELKPDYVLLGTVCQLGEKPAAKVSLSLQLTRTADGLVVWSQIRDLHEDDLISLLAISDPQSLNDLYEPFFSSLLETIPAEITEEVAASPPSVGVLTVHFHKDNVKPGEKMEAEVRVYYAGVMPKPPDFLLVIAGEEHPVAKDGDARLLKASWLAQEQDGTYQVDLVSVLPSGEREVNRIGEYTVDGIAPELTVNFVGKEIDNELYFNKELPIVPRLKIPEALSRWDISVFDKKNELVLLHEGTGQIPPRIIWNGMLSGTEAAPDGRYRVLVQAWDRAENLASFEGFVNLMNTKPVVKVTVERAESDVHVQMENEVASPLAFWFAKVYEKNGGMLTMQIGETLPAALDFKLAAADGKDPLELIFAGQDIYGNRIWQKVDDLLSTGIEKVQKEFIPESQWLENF
jgi:TolB-like protein